MGAAYAGGECGWQCCLALTDGRCRTMEKLLVSNSYYKTMSHGKIGERRD